MISIHAPTRGATREAGYNSSFGVFQSTLPREERQRLDTITRYVKNFNPRSHERSDQTGSPGRLGSLYFNPRSHERSDSKKDNQCQAYQISIHAPTRGATSWYSLGAFSQRFQSTLPREERLTRTTTNRPV